MSSKSEQSALKAAETAQLTVRESLPALLVIGIGVLLLVANLFQFPLMNFFWPGFVIAPGLMMLWPAHSSTPQRQHVLSFLAVPGAMFVTIGLLLFTMNVTNHFEAWAYSWTLVLASVGAALLYLKRFEPQHSIHQSGYRFVRFMVLAFMVLAAFFEIVVFESFMPLLPLTLIGVGIYVLVKNRREATV